MIDTIKFLFQITLICELYIRKFEPISKRTRNVRSGSTFGLTSALLFSVCNFSRLRVRKGKNKEQTISILTEKWSY